MAKLGSPLGFRIGGGDSVQSQVYQAMLAAVGIGGSAPGEPHESIMEAWRMARARGLAAAFDDGRAAMQISPALATDFIPVYEDILRQHFAQDTPDEARREVLVDRYVELLNVAYATLLEQLQAINPNATIVIQDRTTTRDTQHGRVFEDYDTGSDLASGPPMDIVDGKSGAKITSFPNFSSDFILAVESPPEISGNVSQTDILRLRLISEFLNRVLPSWVDYRAYIACGFTLDEDPLDATVFCS